MEMFARLDTLARLLDGLATHGLAARRLCADSRRLRAGEIFLACPGRRGDGRQHIAAAIAAGAAAVLWESGDGFDPGPLALPAFGVRGLSGLAAMLAARMAGEPSRALAVTGITGTNGKTSISWMLAQALERSGRRCGLIGTLGTGFAEALSAHDNTTPDAVSVHGLLADFRDAGAVAAAMEVSSIGIDQGRVAAVHFDTLVFANLSRDHLDYHGDMNAYGACKASLFAMHPSARQVINVDDDFGLTLARRQAAAGVELIVCGCNEGRLAEFPSAQRLLARGLEITPRGQRFELGWQGASLACELALVGSFNVANALAVAAVLLGQGIAFADLPALLAGLQPPPGRMQRLGGEGQPLVVVDYAHTPDALAQVLTALRALTTARGGLLHCVFGCGGGRDAGKRPQMGAVAARLADRVVLTSDNPRHESPAAIIAAIAAGVRAQQVEPHCVESRSVAIAQTLARAMPADVVLIAGKGHENHQEIGSQRLPFSDLEQAAELLRLYSRPGASASC